MRIPIPTTFDNKAFSFGKTSVNRSYTKNVVYKRTADGRILATQRPGVSVNSRAGDEGAGAKGRGIYYWKEADLIYAVNDNVVYTGNSYDTALVQNITTGTERIDFFEIGDYLVLIDSENNEGWYIQSGATATLVKITDVDFPPNQTPALTLTKGGAVLNETLYVGCTNGEIWNSSVEDPTAWAGTDFITAEVSKDKGVYLTKHNQHVVFFGRNTIEFFYDAGNPTGSPLNVRTDVTLEVGAADEHTVWRDDDSLYFVGASRSAGANVYALNGFQLSVISNTDISQLLQDVVNGDTTVKAFAEGFSSSGRSFYILTLYTLTAGVIAPIETYVYDSTGGWSIWSICLQNYCDYPVIAFSGGSVSGAFSYGMLHNGDIFRITDNNYTVDLELSSGWVEPGWVETGWVAGENTLSGDYINCEFVLPPFDAGTMDYKYASNLKIVRTPQNDYYETFPAAISIPTSSNEISVQWSDDNLESYYTPKTINLFEPDSSIRRCGRFRTRQHKITYAGLINLEIEAIELDIEKGM